MNFNNTRFVIGVILISKGNIFFDEVINGINDAATEIREYNTNVILKTMKGYDPHTQIQLINSMENKINILVINPIESPEIKEKINELTDKGINVITVNTDIEGSKRLCHIGNDYYKSGRTAGGILGLISKENCTVGIITGSSNILGHKKRIEGFKSVIFQKYPNIKIVAQIENNDDEIISYDKTDKMLTEHKDINMIYITAGGVYGACCAIKKHNKKISVVCFDKTPTTKEFMEKGIIKAVICQQPYVQGYRSIKIAFNYISSGERPLYEINYINNEIKIEENI